MNYQDYFSGKKITLMGLGLLGRGIGDATFLAEQGAELIVTDLKSEEELQESIKALEGFSNIEFVLGEHRMEDFQNRDLIIKAAGVPLDTPYIAEAERNDIPVRMSTALFAEFTPATIVGVTGTRGKSTVTYLIEHILRTAGKQTFLGGNVKGVSTLAHLPESSKDEIAVLELDSWQLQGFKTSQVSPHVAVFTTFMKDHLNYYQTQGRTEENAMSLYLADKANIFLNQTEKDYLILGPHVAELIQKKYRDHIKAEIRTVWTSDVDTAETLPGEHNRENVACAIEVARLFNIAEETILKAVKSFPGVPGRLELVRERRGIKIYNDTNATTPDATLVGLKALSSSSTTSGHNQNIILIVGGADKQLDMSELIEALPQYTKRVILIPGTGTDKLKTRNLKRETNKYEEVESLEKATQKAWESAERGDVILFSPAFASFGAFKNEYDRGEQFNALVEKFF